MTQEQRARLQAVGRQQYIREEMTRLGFWPPSEEVEQQSREAEAQLKVLYNELVRLQTDLNAIDAEISQVGDIAKLIGEIRTRRIQRVRAERAKKKEERAAALAAKRTADAAWRKETLPFLGRGVSGGLSYADGDDTRRESFDLPSFTTAEDVAKAIGITTSELAFLTYQRSAASADHYSRFTIPKKRGGVRTISSPKRRLRVAQGWLLLSILEKLPVHEAAMAFRAGRSVVDNATQHQGRAVIVKVDLKDFFPSVGVGRVKGLFRKLGYNEGVATLLALIATETPRIAVTLDGKKRWAAIGERSLPQGACTSPAITNILCRTLDTRLTAAAAKLGFTYTRYADDLVFSHASTDAPVGILLSLVRDIVTDESFTVNEQKTQVLRATDRQTVTGLVVNCGQGCEDGIPRLSRVDLRRFRAFLHGCRTKGVDTMSQQIGKDAMAYASGYLSFIHMARPDLAAKIAQENPWLTRWKK